MPRVSIAQWLENNSRFSHEPSQGLDVSRINITLKAVARAGGQVNGPAT